MSELNIQVEELSPVVKRVQVGVPAERVHLVTEEVYLRLARTVRLKGYRQGHVPRRVLEKHFAAQVREDVAREVVRKTFNEALDNAHIHPVGQPAVEPGELKSGEDFTYSARVEVRPTVTIGEWKGLSVSVPSAKVEESAVDGRLEQLREGMTELVPVEDRDVAEMGDAADISYEVEFVGTGRAPQKRDQALVRIEAGLFVEGHGEKLAGMKIGETRSFSETLPNEEDTVEELRGKEAKLVVTLKTIKRREMPALDDEFAKDVAGVDTLDALKAKVRKEIEDETNANQAQVKRQKLLEALIEKNPIEVPPAMVDATAEQLSIELVTSFMRRGMPIPKPEQMVQQFKHEMLGRATFDVKSVFLLEAIAKAEEITVSAEDLNARIETLAAEEGVPVAKIKARYPNPQALSGLAAHIRNDRAYDKLAAAANVTEESK